MADFGDFVSPSKKMSEPGLFGRSVDRRSETRISGAALKSALEYGHIKPWAHGGETKRAHYGLPLSYNRDMQEDKVHLFEGIDTWSSCLSLMHLMLTKTSWNTERMRASLKADFSNATNLADDLVQKGISFREAHEVVGAIVQKCIKLQVGLEDLSLSQLREGHSLFDQNSLDKVSHDAVLRARNSEGGTSPTAVAEQILKAERALKA